MGDWQICERLGKNLARYRVRAGLTQQQLADRIGSGIATIGAYECGSKSPTLAKLAILAEAVGVQPWQLLR